MWSFRVQLFSVPSVRYFRSGVVPQPIALKKDIERWQEIHKERIMKLLARNRISDATTYFYQEVKNPTHSIYSLLLAAIGKSGHSRLAFHLFRDMRARDMRPTPAVLTSLFNACANNDEKPQDALAGAKNLYEQMNVQGWTPTSVTYHAMMKAFAMLGDGDTCFRLLDEMAEKNLTISADTYNHLLMGCIANKEIGYVLAIRVLRFMLWKRIKPNVKTFNFLLKASQDCGCGSDVAVLNKLLNDARRSQLQDPEITLIGSGQNLLDVRLSDQLVSVAYLPDTVEQRLMLVGGPEGILKQMNYFQIEPTAVTYTYLLSAYPDEEKLMEFVRSLDRTKLDMGFWNQLLKRCIIQQFSCVDEIIKIINDGKMVKDNITYGILAMAAQSPEKIKELIAEMDEKKFIVNEVIMSTLVNNASRRRLRSTLVYLLEYCEEMNIKLNKKALTSLASFFDRASHASQCYSISKYLRRLKAAPEEHEQSRLKQFEPAVWRRDHRRWDPDASEAAIEARKKGLPLEEDDPTEDAEFDSQKYIDKEDQYAEADKAQFSRWIPKKSF